jgi:hypothetical protein
MIFVSYWTVFTSSVTVLPASVRRSPRWPPCVHTLVRRNINFFKGYILMIKGGVLISGLSGVVTCMYMYTFHFRDQCSIFILLANCWFFMGNQTYLVLFSMYTLGRGGGGGESLCFPSLITPQITHLFDYSPV